MVSVFACWASVRWFCSHHFLWLSLRRLLLWCECFIYGLLFQNVWGLGQWLSTGGCLLFSRVSRTSYKCIHNYFQISNFVQEPLFVVVKTIGLPSSSTVSNFVRDGSVNDVVSYWRRLESDCHFRLFSNSWKVTKNTSKDLSNFVSGKAMASSVAFWLRYSHLQNWQPTFSFKIVLSVYNHYSTVAFSNTRLTLWPKNVLRL